MANNPKQARTARSKRQEPAGFANPAPQPRSTPLRFWWWLLGAIGAAVIAKALDSIAALFASGGPIRGVPIMLAAWGGADAALYTWFAWAVALAYLLMAGKFADECVKTTKAIEAGDLSAVWPRRVAVLFLTAGIAGALTFGLISYWQSVAADWYREFHVNLESALPVITQDEERSLRSAFAQAVLLSDRDKIRTRLREKLIAAKLDYRDH